MTSHSNDRSLVIADTGFSDEDAQLIVALVRDFVESEVRGSVPLYERDNIYPEAWIERMKELGIFGLTVPPEYGGVGASTTCYVEVTQEISRGWMSLAGAFGGHSVVARLLAEFGTVEQKERYLPRMATGEIRATMALTEPGGGSDLQSIVTSARRDGDELVIKGSKIWISNARHSQVFALLCRTDPETHPAYQGMSIVLVEPGPGLTISKDFSKLGYKGIEACEIVFDSMRVPAHSILGGEEGSGFRQMMRGLETGRIQVASRALGVATAAFDDALKYSQDRETFGVPIWNHQAIGHYLGNMATKLAAARQLTLHAARRYDSGQRSDLEAGMAKLFASEAAMEIALNAIRIHGGYGYSTEFDVERYFRDAPLMIVGEGTNEIQLNVIVRQLIDRGGLL